MSKLCITFAKQNLAFNETAHLWFIARVRDWRGAGGETDGVPSGARNEGIAEPRKARRIFVAHYPKAKMRNARITVISLLNPKPHFPFCQPHCSFVQNKL